MKRFLAYPETIHADLDDPNTTIFRREIIRKNKFLQQIYRLWYGKILAEIPNIDGRTLEVGTGAGFLQDLMPDLIASEVFWLPGIDLVLNGTRLPFCENSLRAIVMIDVFHHIPQAALFLAEAERCLKKGGEVIMIEPWLTQWSNIIYTFLHHEPNNPDAESWDFPSSGPLSGANEALAWIIFKRDREVFERQNPSLKIIKLDLMNPFLYLLSGGFASRLFFPGWTFHFWNGIEKLTDPWRGRLAMFALIKLQKG